MPATPIIEFAHLDFDHPQYDLAAVERVNPHRGDMRLLDAVVYQTPDKTSAVAYRDVKADEFWVPGHIPGRPLFPGVLMIEAAAQLASFVTLNKMDIEFMGFVGLDKVKFRGQVVPGDRLILLAVETNFRPRRIICDVQGWVAGRLIFEGEITGMPI